MCLNLLGVRIDNLSGNEIEKKVEGFLKNEKFNQIVTVNPEFILRAQKDEKFKSIINESGLNVADGIGVKFSFWRFRRNLKKRITGIDLMWNVLRIAEKKEKSVFLLTNKNGLSSWRETADIIRKKFPSLKVRGMDVFSEDWQNLNYQLKATNYQIVFCNFGAPEQEKSINSLKKQKNSQIRLAMGVGGAFDFISGKVKRAPRWIRIIGMEWLWRLILQPRRIMRIWNAVIVFPVRILLNKF